MLTALGSSGHAVVIAAAAGLLSPASGALTARAATTVTVRHGSLVKPAGQGGDLGRTDRRLGAVNRTPRRAGQVRRARPQVRSSALGPPVQLLPAPRSMTRQRPRLGAVGVAGALELGGRRACVALPSWDHQSTPRLPVMTLERGPEPLVLISR